MYALAKFHAHFWGYFPTEQRVHEHFRILEAFSREKSSLSPSLGVKHHKSPNNFTVPLFPKNAYRIVTYAQGTDQ